MVDTTVLRLNVVFFGYAQARYVFTKIMQEPAFALREAGIPMSNYVNNGFMAAATHMFVAGYICRAAAGRA
jgi:hypothetical protein